MMNVSLTNEVCDNSTLTTCAANAAGQSISFLLNGTFKGPVTFTLDSRKFEYVDLARKTVGTSTPTAEARSTTEESKKGPSRSDEPPAATAGESEMKGNFSTEGRAAE